MIPEWILRRLPFEENETLNRIGGYLRGVCSDIIREKKNDLQKSGDVAEHDILSRIIQTGEFTDEQVADQMLTFLAAGVSTYYLLPSAIILPHSFLTKHNPPSISTRPPPAP